jgi:hypothetical protein
MEDQYHWYTQWNKIKNLKKYNRKNRAMQSHDREYIDRLQMNEIPYLQITIPDWYE